MVDDDIGAEGEFRCALTRWRMEGHVHDEAADARNCYAGENERFAVHQSM